MARATYVMYSPMYVLQYCALYKPAVSHLQSQMFSIAIYEPKKPQKPFKFYKFKCLGCDERRCRYLFAGV